MAAEQGDDATAMAAQDEETHEIGGELLYCGTTDWESVGRSKQGDTRNIISPNRLAVLKGVPIAFVASGSASTHCVAISVDGKCFTWGRNDKGQLGHGDLHTRDAPAVCQALEQYKIVKAGAGRRHTVVVADDGSSLAFGFNKHGQLGIGHTKEEVENLPVRCLVEEATNTYCGADFTVWLSSVEGATILTAGLPQHGQLGHGTDNEYNMKEGSVRLAYEAQPKPLAIAAFAGKTITKVACGNNHTVAVDSDGFVYTWGFGGHGRLGHKEQKDEFSPRLVEVFQKTNVLPPTAVVAAGAAFSACTAGGGQLYMWGRVKSSGDSWMYPMPHLDMSGWEIRSIDCGNTTTVVAAESSCISWGTASYGELGYGSAGPKSSSNPKKIDLLEGMHVQKVACGYAHTLLVVSKSDKLEEIETYEATNADPSENAETGDAANESGAEDEEEASDGEERGTKRGAPRGRGRGRGRGVGRPPARKKAKKDSSDEEDDDDEDDEPAEDTPEDDDFDTEDESEDSEDDYISEDSDSPPRRGRGRGRAPTPRGRGRGRKSRRD